MATTLRVSHTSLFMPQKKQTTTQVASQLKNVDFLSGLPDPELKSLAQTCEYLSLEPEEVLFRDGDPGDAMFIILSGEFTVYKQNKLIATRRSGEYFGEMALIESTTRSANVKATQKSQALKISRDFFHAHFSPNPTILMQLLKTLTQRSRSDLTTLDEGYGKLKNEVYKSSRLKQILDDTSNEIYIFETPSLLITQTNARACTNMGYSSQDITQLHFLNIIGETAEKFKNLTAPLLSGQESVVTFDTYNRRRNGSLYPTQITIKLLQTENGSTHFEAVAQDNTERRALEDKIRHLAFYDNLTSLPNRNLLKDRLAMSLANARRNKSMLAVLLLGIDDFKTINNSHGHHIGDLLLQHVSEQLKSHFRSNDTVGRLDGDIFVLIFDKIYSEEEAVLLARKTTRNINGLVNISGHNIQLHISIGISIYPANGQDAESLFKNAHAALQHAKDQGKNEIRVCTPALQSKAKNRITIESGLRLALDREELLLHYQPKVNLQTGQISGWEALVRWNHPENGQIYPGNFIPVAEESRLIIPLGEWVLRQACRQIKMWEQGDILCPHISVNLSGHQFNSKDIVAIIKNIIQENQINPEHLELEITETVLLDEPDTFMPKLYELKDLGLSLSIDDFGTGYSCLSYLKSMPVDTIKIDQSFIREYPNRQNAAIIKAIVNLAESLDLKTVAEGVEREEQKQFLASIGCDEMQGFLFSRAKPAEEIEKIFKNTDFIVTRTKARKS